jgi:uncharacterized membrane protein
VRLHPRNPFLGFYFALLMLLIAATGFTAIALRPDVLSEPSVSSGGTLLGGTLFAAVGFVPTAVRAVRAIGPWMRHRSTPRDLRRQQRAADLRDQRLAPLLVFGLVALAGLVTFSVVLAVNFEREQSFVSRMLQLEILGGALLLASACLGLAAQKLYFRRFDTGLEVEPAVTTLPA